MDEKTREIIKALIKEIDDLAASQRNVAMRLFKDYPEVARLRELIE